MSLTDQEFLRYSRHVMLDQIGESGQLMIKKAHILIVGLGGLGCAASQYLAAAGVGQLTLIDHDKIESSNLQRQILFNQDDIDLPKVAVAKEKLALINAQLSITSYYQSVFNVPLADLLASVDVVLDCTDSLNTRHYLNQACVYAKRKLVSAAAIQGQGQLISFDFTKQNSPCYQCLVPDQEEAVVNCSQLGVLSPLLGVMGSLQATQAIKLILNQECELNELLIYDAWKMTFKHFKVTLDPLCPCCAD
ncbi:HesA/MoeB/ThiF family protein [Thalassotalea piscium]